MLGKSLFYKDSDKNSRFAQKRLQDWIKTLNYNLFFNGLNKWENVKMFILCLSSVMFVFHVTISA